MMFIALAVGVLAVDVVVPVPSSVVMLAVGALLGPVLGTAVNIAWILFVIGLILAIVFAVMGRRAP